MPDPLQDIEDAQAQRGIGATGFRIYTGAKGDGASRKEARLVLVCWFRAMLSHADQAQEDQSDAEAS